MKFKHEFWKYISIFCLTVILFVGGSPRLQAKGREQAETQTQPVTQQVRTVTGIVRDTEGAP
jgi:hypothetical protein